MSGSSQALSMYGSQCFSTDALEKQTRETEESLSTKVSQTEERLAKHVSETEERLATKVSDTEERLATKVSETEARLTRQTTEAEERATTLVADAERQLAEAEHNRTQAFEFRREVTERLTATNSALQEALKELVPDQVSA